MNILTATNTYLPHIGGVARSVSTFAAEFRRLGHRVTVLAPEFPDAPADETDVVRVPAIQHYNGSDFSLPVPIGGNVQARLDGVPVDVVHSHHPFLLGDTALRISASRCAPVVFTHHTMYEEYTHYVPGDSPSLKRFAIELVTGYCNLCDAVVAPSRTVERVLRDRGVDVAIEVIPTGIDLDVFRPDSGSAFRRRFGIPDDAWVVGHTGRLAPEKNLMFLVDVLLRHLGSDASSHVLIAGEGVLRERIRDAFARRGVASRLHMTGNLPWNELCQAYRAMDVFAFASHSETQGMVIAEALASGVPVVAVDASGVREVVRNGVNGILLPDDDVAAFAAALAALSRNDLLRRAMAAEAPTSAIEMSKERMAAKTVALYEDCIRRGAAKRSPGESAWSTARRRFEEELKIIGNIVLAAGDAVIGRNGHVGRRPSAL